ncbi:transporter [Bifidobacterium sp. DSM 109958]|uniref:Transporter n=1 Tax=Bifidobacterium moraviense TaxID=2675323 RepID=A0A7Y0HYR3_9BIFI|nr:mechanosensitive ion channel domain-containing protein [Bifidobacterium sp. DSM 109958]NMN00667.1 transporter [Bifidobacterium sp. DSM 109958]
MDVNFALQWLHANSGKLVFFVLVMVAAFVANRIVKRWMRRLLDKTDVPTATIFINIVRVVIWIVAISMVLQPVFGINPNTIVTALGVGGVAISLGLKDTIANVIGGFGLMLGKVIQPGDEVTIASATGTVKDITWRHTVIRERNGNELVIPNSVLNTKELKKMPAANEALVKVPFTARAGSDPDAVSARITAVVGAATADMALDGSNPLVKFTGFSPYGIEGEVWAFAKPGVFASTMQDAVVRALADADFLEQRAAIGA